MSAAVPGMGAAGGELPGLGPAGDIDSGAKTGQVAQVSQIVPMAGLNPDGSAAAGVEEPASGTEKGKKKKIIRRKKVQAAEAGDDARATVDMQINRPRRTAGAKRARKKRDGEKKRRQRAVTPEGAEDEIIDQGSMTMGELCKDVKTGKKFSRHDQIKQRIQEKKIKDRDAKIKKMMEKSNPELISLVEDDAPAACTSGTPQQEEEPAASNTGIQMRVVDGQLVVDDRTAMVDRHEKGRAEGGTVEEVREEDEFTKLITSGTHMKRVTAIQWDYAATELFYDGLRQFGTDFELIAEMLKPRNRRQIKLKFNKEERNNPDRINKALTGEKLPINLADWERYSGKKLEEVEAIIAEGAKIDEEHAAEDAAYEEEQAVIQKQKKAEIAANRSVSVSHVVVDPIERERQKAEAFANRSAAARTVLASVGDSEDDKPSGSRGAPAAGTDSAKGNEPARSKSREASAAPKTRKRATKGKGKKNINSANGGGDEFEVFGEVAAAPAVRYVLDYNG
jgi:transcription factor TFIIIB component B''